MEKKKLSPSAFERYSILARKENTLSIIVLSFQMSYLSKGRMEKGIISEGNMNENG